MQKKTMESSNKHLATLGQAKTKDSQLLSITFPETFKQRQKRAVDEKGVVKPGLNDAYIIAVKGIPKHSYSGSIKEATKQAILAAKNKFVPNGELKPLHYDNYGQIFDYAISGNAIEECLNPKQQSKSVSKGIHLSLAEYIDEIINNSIEVEEHPDYLKNENMKRDGLRVNPHALMHRFYGIAEVDGTPYRVMILLREEKNPMVGNGVHAYEATKIKVLNDISPSTSNGVGSHPQFMIGSSYPLANILHDVEKSYDPGKKLLDESKTFI